MMDFTAAIPQARVAYLGVSLELYLSTNSPAVLKQWNDNFECWKQQLAGCAEVAVAKTCFTDADIAEAVAAIRKDQYIDAVVVSALSYTPSLLTVPALQELKLPVVIWNTQFAAEIKADYAPIDLTNNHTVQGIQDITNLLYQRQIKYSIVTGHWEDPACTDFLRRELAAIRAARAAKNLRVMELGGQFAGMGDFEFDPQMLQEVWGPQISSLLPQELYDVENSIAEAEINENMQLDAARFEINPNLTSDIHAAAIRRKLAIQRLLKKYNANAFTMNFTALSKVPGFGQLPFYAINTLMAKGMGYAGEGDAMRAALMRQCYELCGNANFTEIYTVDFHKQLMLMSHMQECNINIAGESGRIQLYRKPFWAGTLPDYPGMMFTSCPGEYTLVSITPTPDQKNMRLITFKGNVPDLPFLEKYDRPYWLLRPASPVAKVLNDYSIAGGPHHLSAVAGHRSGDFARLAFWLGFEFVDLDS